MRSMVQSLFSAKDLLEKLLEIDEEVSNTALLYNRMVETYEKSFFPRSFKMAKRTKISGWAD